MVTPREFWNLRSRTYDQQSGEEYEKAYEKTVANTLKYLKGDFRVLEFACGTGITTVAIAPMCPSSGPSTFQTRWWPRPGKNWTGWALPMWNCPRPTSLTLPGGGEL